MWLSGYGCSTAHGAGVENFWRALVSGRAQPTPLEDSGLLKNKTDLLPAYRVHLRRDLPTELSHRARLTKKLADSWESAGGINRQLKTGVILASTKGFIEDVVWSEQTSTVDTLNPLLDDFLSFTKIQPARRAVVSNACSSVAAALKLAELWFDSRSVDQVVIASADTVGEFVLRGFHSLHALTEEERATPFDQNRSGLQLGEAAAVLVVSRGESAGPRLRAVGLNCEGVAATRPDEEGRSLYLALSEVLKDADKPSFVIAHGTGTQLNDSTEDFVFHALYAEERAKPQITGSKWSVGHTLGVSAALDLIAAAEALETSQTFALPFLKTLDAKFKGDYLIKAGDLHGDSVLVSSLGFGGVHAGLLLEAT